jgi:hypothetical protein
MGLVGADIGLLRKLIAQLSGPMQSDLNGVLADMNDQVQASSTYWVAEDGDKFRAAFAGFVQSTKTQLDSNLANAAKVSGQSLQAIGTATGEATGQPAGKGSGSESQAYRFTWSSFVPNLGNLDPFQHASRLLSAESKQLTITTSRFLLRLYGGAGKGLQWTQAESDMPTWALATRRGLGAAGVVTAVVSQTLTSYSQDKTAHPDWSSAQLWENATEQGVVIGGMSGGVGFAVGKVGGHIGRQLGAKIVQSMSKNATEATEEAEATAQTAEQQATAEAGQATAAASEATAAEATAQTAAQAEASQIGTEEAAAQAAAEQGTVEAGTSATVEAATSATVESGTSAAVETGTSATVEGGTSAAVESGTSAAVETGTSVAAEAGTTAVVEGGTSALAEIGSAAGIGTLAGSEVPVLGNAVGLVVGLAVGITFAFVGSKLGSAIGHEIWDHLFL